MTRGRVWGEARVNPSKALLFLAQRSTPAQVVKILGMTIGALSEARLDPERWVRA